MDNLRKSVNQVTILKILLDSVHGRRLYLASTQPKDKTMRLLVNNEVMLRPLPQHVVAAALFEMFTAERLVTLFYFSESVIYVPPYQNRPSLLIDTTTLQIKVAGYRKQAGVYF